MIRFRPVAFAAPAASELRPPEYGFRRDCGQNPPHKDGFGGLTYTTFPPTGVLGIGPGDDSTLIRIAFELRLKF